MCSRVNIKDFTLKQQSSTFHIVNLFEEASDVTHGCKEKVLIGLICLSNYEERIVGVLWELAGCSVMTHSSISEQRLISWSSQNPVPSTGFVLQMQEVQQSKEKTLANNRTLAEQNLELQPRLEHKKEQLSKRYRCLQERFESFQLRKSTLGRLHQKYVSVYWLVP